MKREGPRNIVTLDGDIITVTIEGTDMAQYCPSLKGFIIQRKTGESWTNVGSDLK
jgi:hypothetical protein